MTSRPDPDLATAGRRSWLMVTLAAIVAVALLAVGAALAVITGIGTQQAPGDGSVDVGFARDMSTHHRQAVGMAGLARDRSEDPALRMLAFDIETSQNQQVGMMQGWLQVWNVPVNSSAEQMSWMAADSNPGMAMAGDAGPMPGMASEAELTELQTLSGNDFDVLFLQLMIRHHQGGLPMAQYAVDNAETDVVRRFALRVLDGQAAEIITLDRLLSERGGSMLPPP